ncbi:hypothetical protein ACQPYE_21490 [Actinosynnema sp. CA-299493]
MVGRDDYNNPCGNPPRRACTGIGDMLSRSSVNGPGGLHSRWVVPATAGGSMGARHVLRNKIKLGIVGERNVLRLSGEARAESGLVVAEVTARTVQPGANGPRLGRPVAACDIRTDPFRGGGYQNYTVEVVDRMGADSFTPDAGVLVTKRCHCAVRTGRYQDPARLSRSPTVRHRARCGRGGGILTGRSCWQSRGDKR